MRAINRLGKGVFAGLFALSLGACSAGTLGNVLGGVLNSPSNQISGSIQSVDTRSQQIFVRQTDGSTLALTYDNRTQVTYQNQNYSVTSLESGDQVVARIQSNGNGNYYTDLIQVSQSASNNGNVGGSGQVYNLSGTVRQIDRTNGWFTVDTQNNGTIQVMMPYNPRTTDVNRFNSLRSGNFVQFDGLYLSNARFQLQSFY